MLSNNLIDVTEDDIKDILKGSLEKLITKDSHLLSIDINERSISHKLAIYIEEQLHETDWDVDCEYNRNISNVKRLNLPPRNFCSNDIKARTVYNAPL